LKIKGHPDIVRLLLKHKAELNTKDASGWTPLHVASAHNDVELVRLLINRGARLNATDNQGHSPLKWARETGSRDVFSYLKSQGGKEFDSTTPQRISKKRQNLRKSSTSTPTTTTTTTTAATSVENDSTDDKATF